MVIISPNNIVTMHRGDTLKTPLRLNIGSSLNPEYYDMNGYYVRDSIGCFDPESFNPLTERYTVKVREMDPNKDPIVILGYKRKNGQWRPFTDDENPIEIDEQTGYPKYQTYVDEEGFVKTVPNETEYQEEFDLWYKGDYVYLAVMEPNQRWEDALIKKRYNSFDYDDKMHYLTIRFDTEDTEYLKPGNYYYEIKLYRDYSSNSDGHDSVDTLIGKTKFVILE